MSPEQETEKIISELADKYQKIGERWYQEKRYSRRVTISLYGFAVSLTLSLFVISPSVVSFRLLFPVYVLGALVLDVLVLTFLAFFQSRWKKFKTDREERIFLAAYNLASELRQYPSPLPTSDASLDLDDIVEQLKSSWTLRFRLAKKTLSSLTVFIRNLRERLSPALAAGKTDDVKLSAWVLAKLCPLLIEESPELSTIEDINRALSMLPEKSDKVQPKLHARLGEWVKTHSSVRWAAAISACIVVASLIFSAGVYLGYPREGFLAGTGGGIAIFVGYLNSLRSKRG